MQKGRRRRTKKTELELYTRKEAMFTLVWSRVVERVLTCKKDRLLHAISKKL